MIIPPIPKKLFSLFFFFSLGLFFLSFFGQSFLLILFRLFFPFYLFSLGLVFFLFCLSLLLSFVIFLFSFAKSIKCCSMYNTVCNFIYISCSRKHPIRCYHDTPSHNYTSEHELYSFYNHYTHIYIKIIFSYLSLLQIVVIATHFDYLISNTTGCLAIMAKLIFL